MAAYHKVEVSLNTNAVEVGIPSPQTVNVTLPTIGPAGPTGSVGPVGPIGPQGVPGTGLEVLTTQGDILYQGASTGQRLGIGTAGQILKVNSGGTAPEWGASPAQANQDLDTTDSPQFLGVFVGEGATEASQVGSVTITTQDGVALSMENPDGNQVSMRWFSPATTDTGNHWAFGCDTLNENANNFFIWDFINNRPVLWANGDTGNVVLGNGYAEGSLPAKVQVIGISPSTATLLGLDNKTAGAIAMQIRAAASQSANLTEWLDSNGDVLASIDSDGNISAPNFPTEVTDLAATGISADYVPVAQGDGTIVWEAQSGGGGGDTVSIQSTAADILSVSSGAISADDAGADRIVYWNNTSNKLTYGTPSDVGAAASSHTHGVADVTGAVASADSRLTDSREWSASTIDQSEAEAGTATTRRAFTAQRVFQAIAAWWAGSAAKSKLDGIATGATANSSDATLLARANHTGTQAATTITGLATVATTGAYGDLSGRPTLGTAAAAATTDFAAASHTHAASAITSGTLDVARLPVGTGSTQVAAGNHTHVVADVTGAAASGSITTSGLTQATARLLGRTSSSTGSIEEIQIGAGLSLSAGELSATSSGGIGGGTGATDNSILRSDGTGGSTLQGSAFIIADNATASPNNTVNHASIQATGGTTNVSVSIVPKGVGAFMLQVPNAAAGGGNARGESAVDLQTVRSAATQVAAGTRSFIGGGSNNSTGSVDSVCCGGTGNTASGFQAGILSGRSNMAGADRSMAGGDANTSSGANSFAFGASNTASAAASIALGESSRSDRKTLFAFASGAFAANGDAQSFRAVLRCKTTTNAAVEMALDGSTTYLTIPSGKVIFCNIKVVGVSSTGATVATFERQYAAKNVGGTSSEVFAAVTIGTDNAAGTSLEIATVDAGDYIRVRPTGLSATIFRWVASVDAVEVAFGT